MISLPVFSQVGVGPPGEQGYPGGGARCGAGLPGRWAGLLRSWPAPAQPAFALLRAEVPIAPLEELRGHKTLVKLQSRQERDLRELHKKHQRKAVALTRRLLDSLAQARAEGRCRPRPGVL